MPANSGQVAAPETARATARRFFTEPEWRAVEAVSARIIPSTETPGAREAEVVVFIDGMLATYYASQQGAYREGLQRLSELSRGRFGREFCDLQARDQDDLLALLASGEVPPWAAAAGFFEMVRIHTIEGFLSDPKYGGNRDRVGWSGLL